MEVTLCSPVCMLRCVPNTVGPGQPSQSELKEVCARMLLAV